MRIGTDIDNVLSNFDEVALREYMLHDKELRNNGIVHPDAYIYRMFDWSREEERAFYSGNLERIAKSLDAIDGAKEYIDKLRSEGHEVYIISGRNIPEYSKPLEMTLEWLEKYDFKYDRLIITDIGDKHAKTVECQKYGVDIFIDDNLRIAEDCAANGIHTVVMDTPYNKASDLPRVKSWEEFYNYIHDRRFE